ncbi:Uncharacterized protein dnl_20010 [Desulfonema limicola]|uniref:Uncharacterized protein n=1 Tax=Desulfonema limicola TaxID=45656 RepID=A0A975GFZ6_9BACT|nr:Uncharacterized protein dnl_20010 [Desulfonema limicola]
MPMQAFFYGEILVQNPLLSLFQYAYISLSTIISLSLT